MVGLYHGASLRLSQLPPSLRVCLMCIVAVWSLLSAHLLLSAQRLETDMETATLSLTDHLVRKTRNRENLSLFSIL